MQHLYIDFETYYDSDVSLKKMGTSEYVQHADFEVQTLAYSFDEEEVAVLVGDEAIRQFFAECPRDIALVAHNMHFDGYICAYHYNFVPAKYRCTQSMANARIQQFSACDLDSVAQFLGVRGKQNKQALDGAKGVRLQDMTEDLLFELVAYNRGDVEALRSIYRILSIEFPEFELEIVDLTIRMFTEPVLLVDAGLAKHLRDNEDEEKRRVAEELGLTPDVFTSSQKFAKQLEEEGYEVPYKYSEKQDRMIPALARTDPDFIRMKDHGDARLLQMIAARSRINSHLVKSRANALLVRADSPLPVGLRYCSAHTFRFGGMDKTNLQNLPHKGDLRNCLLAPPGYLLVIVDAAQIEARVNAWLAGQNDLIAQFRNDEDVYSDFASTLFGIQVNKKDHYKERYIGKTCVLGLGYQMGAERLQDTLLVGRGGPSLAIELGKCRYFVNRYRARYPYIQAQWYKLDDLISVLHARSNTSVEYGPCVFEPGTIRMPNGLSLYYPNVQFHVADDNRSKKTFHPHGADEPIGLYGGILTENIVQSLARTITAGHMLALSRRWRVVHMAHDEIIMCVPERQAEACLEDAIDVMTEPPSWASGLPLKGEGDIAPHYLKPD